MEKKPFMVGNARLSELNGFEDTVKNGVRGCFIPYDLNPSLFIGKSQQTGAVTVDMDILIRETRNSKSGSTHFIKLNVGKSNRERFQMSSEAVDSLKIVGNLFTRMPGQTAQGSQQQGMQRTPQSGYQTRAAAPQAAAYPRQGGYQQRMQVPQGSYPGDMPDFSQQNQQAGW